MQLAAGFWLLANCKCFKDDRISIYFYLFLFGCWQLASGGWLTARASMIILFQNISISFLFCFWHLAAGNWLTARASMIILFQNISIYFYCISIVFLLYFNLFLKYFLLTTGFILLLQKW